MKSLFGTLLALGGLALLGGCTERQSAQELRSLSASEDAVFLCRAADGVGHPYSDCPDRNKEDDDDPARKLSVMALVTQTLTDEVAVVNVTDGHVIDVDPTTPGYGFLRVGARPVSLAVTPGGTASFVATADVGRNGIFALPTRLLSLPSKGESTRDLTTWNACRLPETPGEITVLVDENESCAQKIAAGENAEADLSAEGGDKKPLKLLVSFPDKGTLAVLDAQAVLNAEPGAFPDCEIESELVLAADVPAGVAQTLPADLVPESACTEVPAPTAPTPSKLSPRPAGFARTDNRLYVADSAAPVIHVVDTSSACAPTELAPLLPMSLREPNRVVTTKRLAVSPITPARQQFVYAIDTADQPFSTVMVFDVSPGATDPTPLVRSGSPELAGEKPDRLTLPSSAHDVAFAYRDIPYVDPDTGAAEFGLRCSPDPATTSGPTALARPTSDFTVGARPGLLRGLFGFVLLTSGQIEIIDVDDFDAACRRPTSSNSSSVPDFRGCVGDQVRGPYQDSTGLPLTTNEQSCRIVQPHRQRSARLMLNNSLVGIRSPSLRTFPQLRLPAGEASSASEDRPRMLAVPFAVDGEEQRTDVYVGSSLYSTDGTGGDVLPIDPNGKASDELATQNSVILPPLEPRAYGESAMTLTFEGALAADSASGLLDAAGETFRDANSPFCTAGVFDPATTADYVAKELGLSANDAETFASTHGDYLQITSAFPAESDSYWAGSVKKTRAACVALFGEADAQTLLRKRDLAIIEAYSDRLRVKPKDEGVTLGDFNDCFPTALTYRIRAEKQWILRRGDVMRHDVVASGADRRCVRSCNPLFKWQKGRVFEVSSADTNCRAASTAGTESQEEALSLRVGCAEATDLACVYQQNDEQYRSLVGSDAESCIFNGLTERFAVYRGRTPSVRDMTFTWSTTGGFVPQEMSLLSLSTSVAPQSIQYLSQSEQLAIVDGASQGLSLFSLDTFAVVKPSPFY